MGRAILRTMLGPLVVALALPSLAGCRGAVSAAPGTSGAEPAGPIRYVALGDSYTIGTSVAVEERWPDQLVERFRGSGGPALELVANLAVNGYTSRNVLERQIPELDELEPDFVTLLVGVNDVVQGVPTATYEANASQILDELLARLAPDRVLVVTTPDYTVTPQGASYGIPAVQAAGIRENNAILVRLATERGIETVDIHGLSLAAADDQSLVADDGLHPSGAQYALWVERMMPVVRRLVGGRAL